MDPDVRDLGEISPPTFPLKMGRPHHKNVLVRWRVCLRIELHTVWKVGDKPFRFKGTIPGPTGRVNPKPNTQ